MYAKVNYWCGTSAAAGRAFWLDATLKLKSCMKLEREDLCRTEGKSITI